MPKLISVLEKLNVVERVQEEKPSNDINDKKKDDTLNQNLKPPVSLEPTNKSSSNVSTTKISVENNTPDKSLDIAEIYSLFGMDPSSTNNIFMLGKFINAIPESLPQDVRKESVMNILIAANSNFNNLIEDGEARLNTLNEFTQKFHETVNSKIDEYNIEISKLKSLISDYESKIENKKSMLSKQDSTVKYELQKINSIINFFK